MRRNKNGCITKCQPSPNLCFFLKQARLEISALSQSLQLIKIYWLVCVRFEIPSSNSCDVVVLFFWVIEGSFKRDIIED